MKKHRIKSIVTCLFVFVLLFTPLSIGHAYEKVPTAGVAINGEMVDGIDPIKLDGTYYLPVIYLSKILGYNDIRFESPTKTYELTDGSTAVRLTMGGTRARRGDEYINVEPPRWIEETGYVSLDAASALFNAFIYFKPENGSIQVEKPATKYRVQRGDTLWAIAQAHHTTVQAIKAKNELGSNLIYPGQILKLPSWEGAKEMEPIKEEKPVGDYNPAPAKDVAAAIIEEAKKYIGAGYKFGATYHEAPNLFDCSSYTQFVYGKHGISLPRNSRQQAAVGTHVAVSDLQPGDLVFFSTPDLYSDGRVGHLGIYMGNGDMIHASSSRGVHIAENFLDIGYWQNNYLFAKRVID
ncbi:MULTISPECIES: NlpC/P60 family protein [Bacillaceae]|uniref:C40 family peptidase n=1 Tax=Evansella alkalicola TaxID=745819 RepID=A0ABS6JTK7_9BACI|nr:MULTISPECIES: NlpC/P60 family protein [Bacillaceae]MBU9721411.1 C40 family peptidase [Bacillus alkalicola]